jgi:phospholipid transport system substrate-binding protein
MMDKALAMWLMLAANPIPADTPTQVVQTAVEQVVQVVQEADLEKPEAVARHRGRIQRIAEQLFDFPEMARRTLAQHWKDRTTQERDEFVRLFKDFLARAYFGRLEKYSGEKIVYTGETVDGEYATVRSKILVNGTEIPIDYRLRQSGTRWVVFDIAISGVSFVSSYRGQFHRVIQTSSYEALLRELRLKRGDNPPVAERPAARPLEAGISTTR